ncbi:hypothetical protein N656DRAFT_783990 [Canariomyces notabilis]|uniref:Uncharacterized protein n=1 Tax=Canariomyces notabilis TaxID=2074819 RepID=A0AAN6QEH0_9PEZI|nr:hypothetical protein N656DRAFT_783990 [Canariomyces arenarius]
MESEAKGSVNNPKPSPAATAAAAAAADDPPVPPRAPKISVDPSLRTLTVGPNGVPNDDDAAIEAPVPDVQATTEECFKDFDTNSITHVVIQVSISKQQQIFHQIGYQYTWNFPFPFWHFLGKMVVKALYNDQRDNTELQILSFTAIKNHEFVAFTTSAWRAANTARKAAGVTELPPLNVIEVSFMKPQPGQRLQISWQPARGVFTGRVRLWTELEERRKQSTTVTS